MYFGLLHFHSLWRYVVLILLIAAVSKTTEGWIRKRAYSASDNKLSLYALIATHIQLVMGILLYVVSPFVRSGWADMGAAMKNPELRFWTVEHTLMMLIAVTLITLGRVLSKRAVTDLQKHKRIALWMGIGFLIILMSIPWPFSGVARAWL